MFAAEDTVLNDHISKPLLKNATYIHHRSQNEMVAVIGKYIIQQDIINEVKEAKIHTILCDEVTSSNDDIMSLCIRFVDAEKQIREEFIDFIHVERITGEVLFEAVVNFYKRNDIHLEDLRGQCYDGATNMSAVKKGLSGRALEVNPKALYTLYITRLEPFNCSCL